jgi:hypothetical protein
MSSFDEIKGLFSTELSNSPQYLVATKIKNLIIEDILAPKIDIFFTYVLVDSDYVDIANKQYENEVIILCMKLILGITVEIGNIDNMLVVEMSKFLN